MPRCTPCMGAALKRLSVEQNPELEMHLRTVKNCDDPLDVQFCPTGGGKKRAPSAYNMFVSDCIKRHGGVKKFGDAAAMMKTCAAEWRERKGQ